MKKIIVLMFALALATAAQAQTATPTSTPTSTSTPTQVPFIVGVSGFDLTASTSDQKFALGIPYWGAQGMFMYVQATETTTQGDWVFVDEQNKLTLTDTTEASVKPFRVCVANSAMTTTNKYGWAWCGAGVFGAHVASGVAATDPLTTTATAGVAGIGGAAITSCVNVAAGAGASTLVTVRCGMLPVVNIPALTPTATPTP